MRKGAKPALRRVVYKPSAISSTPLRPICPFRPLSGPSALVLCHNFATTPNTQCPLSVQSSGLRGLVQITCTAAAWDAVPLTSNEVSMLYFTCMLLLIHTVKIIRNTAHVVLESHAIIGVSGHYHIKDEDKNHFTPVYTVYTHTPCKLKLYIIRFYSSSSREYSVSQKSSKEVPTQVAQVILACDILGQLTPHDCLARRKHHWNPSHLRRS